MPSKTRAQDITNVMDRLPIHLQPRKGSFEDIFSRACAEIALAANVDETGVSIVEPGAVLYLARLLCGRSLPSGDCHTACRLQYQCVGSSRLVLASFGAQARACLEALGLRVTTGQAPVQAPDVRCPSQSLLLDLRKAEPAA